MHGPWMLRLMRELNGRDGAGVVGGAVCPLEDELGGGTGEGQQLGGLGTDQRQSDVFGDTVH